MSFPGSEPIPEEARQHLEARGGALLRQLDALRAQEHVHVEIGPLDPAAQLALRKHGDQLLAELEQRRDELPAAASVRKRRFPWVACAACAAGIGITCTWLIDIPGSSVDIPTAAIEKATLPTPEIDPAWDAEPVAPTPSTTVPEPCSSLLTLAGGVLLLRRRRP